VYFSHWQVHDTACKISAGVFGYAHVVTHSYADKFMALQHGISNAGLQLSDVLAGPNTMYFSGNKM
jgi:hypothetical protein